MLYERVGLSENRDEVLALAKQGVIDERPAAQLRDPYVFEFLGLRPSPALKERGLEQALIEHLQQFLLELGRDFCFVDRQFRITAGNRHRYLDLLFFHRRLRCLVAVDLKLGEFQPEHAGQMRFYLRYLAENVALPDENRIHPSGSSCAPTRTPRSSASPPRATSRSSYRATCSSCRAKRPSGAGYTKSARVSNRSWPPTEPTGLHWSRVRPENRDMTKLLQTSPAYLAFLQGIKDHLCSNLLHAFAVPEAGPR